MRRDESSSLFLSNPKSSDVPQKFDTKEPNDAQTNQWQQHQRRNLKFAVIAIRLCLWLLARRIKKKTHSKEAASGHGVEIFGRVHERAEKENRVRAHVYILDARRSLCCNCSFLASLSLSGQHPTMDRVSERWMDSDWRHKKQSCCLRRSSLRRMQLRYESL